MTQNGKQIETTETACAPEGLMAIPPEEAAVESAVDLDDQGAGESNGRDVIEAAITGLAEAMAAVRTALDTQAEQVAELVVRDELLGRLHDRLAGYEQDERVRSFIAPLTRKIAALHRRILDQKTHLTSALRALPRELRAHTNEYWAYKALDGIRVELETILADFGVESFICEADRFDRRRQEAIRRVATDNAEQIGVIAQRLAPGFQLGDRIIVTERVAVFVGRSDAGTSDTDTERTQL